MSELRYNPGYDHAFYEDLENTALPSARIVLPILQAAYPFKSAVDFGCGDGSWLSVVAELGGDRVLGLDGPWVEEAQLKISSNSFRRSRIDIGVDLDPADRFDLAISLEVAEHLPVDRAPSFVSELCKAAPVVLFSAAIPGQGGHHHVNEQWPDYWAALFSDNGYRCLDFLRMAVWNDPSVCWWYKQNCLVFVDQDILAASPKLGDLVSDDFPAPLVHPEVLEQALRESRPGFGKWIRQGGKAIRRTVAKRRARRSRR